jgi:Putative Actinobacterial Holin-X, holin superfamily III
MPEPITTPAATATADLVRDAVTATRHLVEVEVALAKDEVRREIQATKTAGITLAAGAVAAISALAALLVALAMAIEPGPISLLVTGGILLLGSGAAIAAGTKMLPKKLLPVTARRVENDIRTVKEHAS